RFLHIPREEKLPSQRQYRRKNRTRQDFLPSQHHFAPLSHPERGKTPVSAPKSTEKLHETGISPLSAHNPSLQKTLKKHPGVGVPGSPALQNQIIRNVIPRRFII